MSGTTETIGTGRGSGAVQSSLHETARSESRDRAGRASLEVFAEILSLTPEEMMGLGPEFLIQLAQKRLAAIDNSIKGLMTQMNNRSEVIDRIRAASTLVEEWRTQHMGDDAARLDYDTPRTVTNADGSTRETTLARELRAAGIDPANFSDGAQGPTRNNLDGLINAIRNKSDQLQQGAELEQMRLQQLVQSRGQFVQTCSQVMSANHETEKSIVANIRG